MRLSRYKNVRIYCEIVTDITGFGPAAIWEDTKLGFGHFFDSERRAVVSDVEWVHHVTKLSEFLRFLWPGEYRSLSESESTKAREWISKLNSECEHARTSRFPRANVHHCYNDRAAILPGVERLLASHARGERALYQGGTFAARLGTNAS